MGNPRHGDPSSCSPLSPPDIVASLPVVQRSQRPCREPPRKMRVRGQVGRRWPQPSNHHCLSPRRLSRVGVQDGVAARTVSHKSSLLVARAVKRFHIFFKEVMTGLKIPLFSVRGPPRTNPRRCVLCPAMWTLLRQRGSGQGGKLKPRCRRPSFDASEIMRLNVGHQKSSKPTPWVS